VPIRRNVQVNTMSEVVIEEAELEKLSRKEIDELVLEVFKYLPVYLLEGKINRKFNADLNILGAEQLDFDTALKIRFLLDKQVSSYLHNLETLLRRIRTEVSREREIMKGQIRGHVDWRLTIQQWAQSGFKDKTNFVVSKPIKNYDIPENLILKKIVSILNNFINEDKIKKEIKRDYFWSKLIKENQKHLHVVLRNVYFEKIKDGKKIHVSSRMKSIVRKSRKKLYRESCNVYERYEKVFDTDCMDKKEFETLLRETFIEPNNIEKLFELYCLFKIIDVLVQMGWKLRKLKEVKQRRKETAILTYKKLEDPRISIFYNVTSPLKFLFKMPEEIKDAQKEIAKQYFDSEKSFPPRRPDIILELVNRNQKNYLIFEIKYTRKSDTIKRGILQALRYLYDITDSGGKEIFGDHLGNGYNAAVIARHFPKEIIRDNNVGNKELKVKLFDSTDLKNPTQFKEFLGKFLQSSGVNL